MGGNCFNEYVVSVKRIPDSDMLRVVTKVVSYCTCESHALGFNQCEGEGWKQAYYTVRCKTPDGFIQSEDPGAQRLPEPEEDPPHATEAAKQLWMAICRYVKSR